MTLALNKPMTLKPEDFDPPLKRKEPIVPYYWTVEELANELGASIRKIQLDITGSEKQRVRARLNAIKVGTIFLVPDKDALEYVQQQRKSRTRS